MTFLLEGKEKLKILYGRYGTYISPILKFILALFIFSSINRQLGYLAALNNIFVVLILALICSIIPLNGIAVFGGLLIIGHCFGLSLVAGIVAVILFVVIEILYLRFVQGDSLALVLMPVASSLGIPCAVPIGFGLMRGPMSAISVSCGVAVCYFLDVVKANAAALQNSDSGAVMENFQVLLNGFVNNREMLMVMIASITVTLVVSVVRRLSVDYSWHIAIVLGAVTYVIIMIAGGMFVEIDSNIPVLIVGAVISCVISLILEFFVYHVDYSRTEYLQYEDDEYYYYVKAVPKISITNPQREVKTIRVDREEDFAGKEAESAARHTAAAKEPDYEDVDFESKLEESLENLQK